MQPRILCLVPYPCKIELLMISYVQIIVWQYLQRQYSGMALRLLRLKLKRLIIYSLVALHWITCIFHYFTKRYGSDYTGYEGFKKKCFCDEDSNYICSNNKLAPEAWFHTKSKKTNTSRILSSMSTSFLIHVLLLQSNQRTPSVLRTQ